MAVFGLEFIPANLTLGCLDRTFKAGSSLSKLTMDARLLGFTTRENEIDISECYGYMFNRLLSFQLTIMKKYLAVL